MKKILNIAVFCGVALALSGCWKKKQGGTDSPAAGKELGAASTTDSKNLEVAVLDTEKKILGEEEKMEEKLEAAKEGAGEESESLEDSSEDKNEGGEVDKNSSKKK